MAYVGWLLSKNDRIKLLNMIETEYPDVLAHHVTYKMGNQPLPPEVTAEIVGIADDDGVQALVVSIDGFTNRWDNSTYHITWSINRALGKKPVDSNKVIKEYGWTSIEPIKIKLIPTLFK